MVFTSDLENLIVGSQINGKSGLRNFASETGSLNWKHDGFESYWIRGLSASPGNKLIASEDEKGWLRLWNSITGHKLYEANAGLVIQAVSFSEDGTQLAVALWNSTIGIVEIKNILN